MIGESLRGMERRYAPALCDRARRDSNRCHPAGGHHRTEASAVYAEECQPLPSRLQIILAVRLDIRGSMETPSPTRQNPRE